MKSMGGDGRGANSGSWLSWWVSLRPSWEWLGDDVIAFVLKTYCLMYGS